MLLARTCWIFLGEAYPNFWGEKKVISVEFSASIVKTGLGAVRQNFSDFAGWISACFGQSIEGSEEHQSQTYASKERPILYGACLCRFARALIFVEARRWQQILR